MMPSWITPACNPSGGINVVEHGSGFTGFGLRMQLLACPLQVES